MGDASGAVQPGVYFDHPGSLNWPGRPEEGEGREMSIPHLVGWDSLSSESVGNLRNPDCTPAVENLSLGTGTRYHLSRAAAGDLPSGHHSVAPFYGDFFPF